MIMMWQALEKSIKSQRFRLYIYIYKITYVERDFKRYEMNVAIMCVCERERVIKSASGKPKIFLLSIHSPS